MKSLGVMVCNKKAFGFLASAFSATMFGNAALASQHAHEHGLADMSISSDGRLVTIEFISPMANLIGFEREPRSDEELQIYRDAISRLESDELFVFTGANCQRQAVELDAPYDVSWSGHNHDDHDHDEGDHDHAHDDDHDHDESQHADLIANFTYDCGDASRLRSVDVGLFAAFSGFQEIETIYLGERTAVATLTPSRSNFRLER